MHKVAKHEQRGRQLECADGSFLTEVTEELKREGALLDFILTNHKEPHGADVETGLSFASGSDERVEFRILRREKKSRVASIDFRRADFS